jgi:hypothetical protein
MDATLKTEIPLKPLDTQVQSPQIAHGDPVMHVTRDIDGLPIPHPAEQPRHVIERALNYKGRWSDAGLTTEQIANHWANVEVSPKQPDAQRVELPAENGENY